MERWLNRVAVVTGASSGIGASVVKYLANNGMVTVGLARRMERIEALRNEVGPAAAKRIHAIQCDVQSEEQIIAAFKEIETKYGPVAVLVNNAGVSRMTTTLLTEGNTQAIRETIDTNVFGVVYCTREAFRSMKTNGSYGHIFLINSAFGHKVPVFPNNTFNIYPPSKHAVTAMTEVYRQELLEHKNIKITSISPGGVDTEFVPSEVKEYMPDYACLKSDDIADALLYCLQTPPHVQIHELTIKPIGEMI